MVSPFDDLDRKKLDETHASTVLLNKQFAQLQSRLDKLIKLKANHVWGRKYLRTIIRQQREKLTTQTLYINQLENELRLRGLE